MNHDANADPDPPAADQPGGALEAFLRWVERKDLQVPVAMLLEMHRPLLPLAWPTAMLVGGLVAPLFGPDYYRKIAALRDPAALDRILKRLDGSRREGRDQAE